MKNTLEIDSLILEFGMKRVLHDVYLKCETGKITGLLGRNGSGKTCLMNVIFGTLTTAGQSVRVNGKTLLKVSRQPKTMRYLPQFNFIPKSLTLKRIFTGFKLDFSTFIKKFPEFSEYHNSKLKRLSGGEQRIVEIYIILCSNTKFCLLDEPFSQVMLVHIETIKNLLVQEKSKKGILITDHLYKHIIDICDDLYVIADGKTHLTKSIEEIENLGYINIQG